MAELDLLCDEDWLASTPPPPPPPPRQVNRLDKRTNYKVAKESTNNIIYMGSSSSHLVDQGSLNTQLLDCLEREATYMPEREYVEGLRNSPQLVHARSRAINYFIKCRSRLNFVAETVFYAVNYFDRFVSKKGSEVVSTVALVELLSIACFSLAAKFNEISGPQLQDFQMAGGHDMENTFQSGEIRRVELRVLETLQWRLRCTTAYSYLEVLSTLLNMNSLRLQLQIALIARMSELILPTLYDPKFVEFKPCVVAASALRCGLEEVLPSKSNFYLSTLINLINHKEEIENCYKVMEERVADPLYTLTTVSSGGYAYFPSSPVTVMASPRQFNCHVDLSLSVSSASDLTHSLNPKKRKLEENV
ncbi:hypothetical protein Sjap_013527 [Stephania japonica]|uniref:Cyclin-like domain-containing protein n=1 Tax=Stephania japonica TaxID=461633 RepID=A0AAP0P007_9MAGN